MLFRNIPKEFDGINKLNTTPTTTTTATMK